MPRLASVLLASLLLSPALPAMAQAPVLIAAADPAPRWDPMAAQRRQATGEDLLFVDVRLPEDYTESHVYGACNVPITKLERSSQGLPRNRTLVLYCTCPDEHSSMAAAAMLKRRGYTKLAVLKGGLDAWQEVGFKVVSNGQVSGGAQPTPAPTTKPSPTPTPKVPPATPEPAPDQRSPMDEQRGLNQSP